MQANDYSVPAQLTREIPEHSLEIAIIGMAGRFPGADSIDQFWQNLRQGVDSVSTFGDDEVLASGVASELVSHPQYVKRGGILANVDQFDAAFFGIYPREAEIMDPQQRVFLELAWEALENAGYNPDAYEDLIGVYAGVGMNTYLLFNLYPNQAVRETVHGYQLTIANDKDYLPTRTSYKLNLRGPSINVQTACSTSLVATHLAVQGLLNYQCDIALAGGVSIRLPQESGYLYQEGGIASPDGFCRAFDARAQGTVSGNGAGIVVLKRLTDALADGDTIHAVIKGSAINNDGALKVGYTAPSVEGQAEVIAMAQAVAEVDPTTIEYVEAHGTGTALGDPIEIAALTEVFRRSASQGRSTIRKSTGKKNWCAIGSVKTNVGHLDAAAGVASLIKATLALEHGEIPPSLHFETPNPNIDFENSPFYVNTRLQEWPSTDTPRRTGVSSFGIGGTNVHVVLEETPALDPPSPSREWQLLVLSARTPEALEAASRNLAHYLRKHPDVNLSDVAYTLQVGRKSFEHRRFVLCRTIDEALAQLESRTPPTDRCEQSAHTSGPRPVVFMFTGQGAQYVGMARGLYESEPVFREHLDHCAEVLSISSGLDLLALLYPEREGRLPAAPDATSDLEAAVGLEPAELLGQTANTQPALFSVEYALAQLLMSWGVVPEAMIGHSIGEYVAACLAGVFALEDALPLVAERGKLMQALPTGSMMSVGLPEAELRLNGASGPYLSGNLSLAASNGPGLSVVSGPSVEISDLAARLEADGIPHRRLHTSHAFHSAMMEPMLGPFMAAVQRQRLSPPQTPFVSNVTGTWITPQEATNPAYWARHLRETVRFGEGIATLAEIGGGSDGPIFLEVGPGTTLSTLSNRVLREDAFKQADAEIRCLTLSTLPHPRAGRADSAVLLEALGQLWASGIPIDWRSFYADEFRRRIPLPTYQFQRQRYWIEPDSERQMEAAPASVPATQPERGTPTKPSDPARWFYLPSWHRKDLPPSAPILAAINSPDEPRTSNQRVPILVLGDQGPLTRAVVRELEAWGWPVIAALDASRADSTAILEPGAEQVQRPGHEHQAKVANRDSSRESRTRQVNPGTAADYDALLESLETAGLLPERIIHLWSLPASAAHTERREGASGRHLGGGTLPPDGDQPADDDWMEALQVRGFDSLLLLAQALDRRQLKTPVRVHVVTAGLQDVLGDESIHPGNAPLLAAAHIVPQEFPFIQVQTIDLPEPWIGGPDSALKVAGEQWKRMTELLASEIILGQGQPTVAYRGTRQPPTITRPVRFHRWVEAYERVDWLSAETPRPPLRNKGVYLVTGGLGNLGLLLARYLAEACQARLVLLTRSGLAPDDTSMQARLQRLEEMGAEVLVLAADVADGQEMAEALQSIKEHFGELHGVFHAAGLVGRDHLAPVTALQPEDRLRHARRQHFRAKVQGVHILAELLHDTPLDFVVLHSSLSTVLGGLGMAAYAGANCYMDLFAARETRRNSVPWLAIDWDGWRFSESPQSRAEADQQARNSDSARHSRRSWEDGIGTDHGYECFARALSLIASAGASHQVNRVVVSTGDLDARRKQWVLGLSEARPGQAAVGEPEDALASLQHKWAAEGQADAGQQTPGGDRAPTSRDGDGRRAGAEADRTTRYPRPALRTEYMAARDSLEQDIIAMWERVLGIAPIGVYDDFFELGGHSLLATQIVSRLRDTYHVELPLRDLFESPTVAALAAFIRDRRNGPVQTDRSPAVSRPTDSQLTPTDSASPPGESEVPGPRIRPIPREGALPVSYGQQRLWFLDQLQPGSPLYNNFAALHVTGPLDAQVFEQALNAVIRRHEVLRTTFADRGGRPVPMIADESSLADWHLAVEVIDLEGSPDSEQPEQPPEFAFGPDRDLVLDHRLVSLALAEARLPFDLSTGPLVRAKIVRLNRRPEQQSVVFFTMHHMVSDGWSVAVLIKELLAFYEIYLANGDGGRPADKEHPQLADKASVSGKGAYPADALPPLPIQYVDWAHWQREWLKGDVFERQLDYWSKQLGGQVPPLELSTDRPRPAVQTANGANEWFELPLDLLRGLEALGRQEGATLFMTLLAGLQTLLYRYTGQEDFAIGTPVANRGRQETEELIGFLLNTLVLRANLSPAATAMAGSPRPPTFREVLRRVRETAISGYSHQELPFEMLVEELQPERDMSRSPLFQVMFDLQGEALDPASGLERAGIEVRPLAIDPGTAKFDLALSMEVGRERLGGYLNYNTDLFDRGTIVRMLGHFRALLRAATNQPDRSIAALPLLTRQERGWILQASLGTPALEDVVSQQGAAWKTIARQVEQWAVKTPDALACVMLPPDSSLLPELPCEHERLTYAQLNARADRVAQRLLERGVGPGRYVALCLKRSLDMIVGILGVLKSGAAFVPLDPQTPAERLSFMISDSRAALVLADDGLAHHDLPPIIRLDEFDAGPSSASQTGAEPAGTSPGPAVAMARPQREALSLPEAGDPAYLIYTSGSTGVPKGVVITQEALAKHCQVVADHFRLTPADRVLQFSAYTFDQALEQILATLASGAKLMVRGGELWPPEEFPRVVRDAGLTVINLPPAYWNQIIRTWATEESQVLAAALRLIIVGGDALTSETLELWRQSPVRHARLLNAYGPTETTITATTYDAASPEPPPAEPRPDAQRPPDAPSERTVDLDRSMEDRGRTVPIGQPLPGRTAYILDGHGNLQPFGVPGELHLGGLGLALGYLGQPRLTAERFVPDPFPQGPNAEGVHSTQRGNRLYKTGDLVRRMPNGAIEFLGRADLQVKIRGFRVELGEIEATLKQHPAVHEAAVALKEFSAVGSHPLPHDQAPATADRRLVAYVVPVATVAQQSLDARHPPEATSVAVELSTAGARALEKEPAAFPTAAELRQFLEGQLPAYMVPSAVVFLESLPLTASGKIQRQALPLPEMDRNALDVQYAAPTSPVEEELAAIWAQVLGVSRVGIHDNFFDLGGHSLLATQILSRVRSSFPVDLPLRRLFEQPTVAGLAAMIEQALVAQQEEAELEALLAELEAMSDEEVNHLLSETPGTWSADNLARPRS